MTELPESISAEEIGEWLAEFSNEYELSPVEALYLWQSFSIRSLMELNPAAAKDFVMAEFEFATMEIDTKQFSNRIRDSVALLDFAYSRKTKGFYSPIVSIH